MKQRLGIITLGITNLSRSKHFYREGFGWEPIFEDEETVMYQMNGFVLSTWLRTALENDMKRSNLIHEAAFSLAYNAMSADEVQKIIDHLVKAGGHVLRYADKPAHGGMRGYVTDPDHHAWEIIWNPMWKVDNCGWVTLAKQ